MKLHSLKTLFVLLAVILILIVTAVSCQVTTAYYLSNTDSTVLDTTDVGTSSADATSSDYLSSYDLSLLSQAKSAVSPTSLAELEKEIRTYLDNDLGEYSLYLQDLKTGEKILINSSVVFSPASIAKVPVAILVLRDIEAGKYTLDTTYPMYDSQKFSYIGDLGSLPNGTPVTMRQYLEEMIGQSDNNAWYALTYFLGGNYEVVNPRIIEELHANPFFLDPHTTTAANVGNVFSDLYNGVTLSATSRNYLISLMENADSSLRTGIGLGLPSGTRFANKIGFLDTDTESSYQDAAIVWGTKTNYVLVILDKNQDWGVAQSKLSAISKMVYNFLEY